MTDPIAEVLGAMSKKIHDERKNSPLYQELAARPNLTSRLRLAEHRMSEVVLALTDVLRDEDGVEIDHVKYELLKALVTTKSSLTEDFKQTEGNAGCVDKAYQEIARRLRA